MLTLASFQLFPQATLSERGLHMRLWYGTGFLDVDGLTVLAGNGSAGFYVPFDCSVTDSTVLVEAEDIFTTLDANVQSPQSIKAFARLYGNNTPKDWVFTGWVIPSEAEYPGGVITLEQLTIYNTGANTLANPPSTYLTEAMTVAYFNTLTTNNNASDIVKGITYLDVAPAVPTHPEAVGINSARALTAAQRTLLADLGNGEINSASSIILSADTDASGAGEFFVKTRGLGRFQIDNTGATVVGTPATPDPSAILKLQSTTKGFLPPRMTTAQRGAIAAPPAGLLVDDTDLNAYMRYTGAAWATLAEGYYLQTGPAAPTSPSVGDLWLSSALANVSVSPRAADRTVILSPTLPWEGLGVAEANVYKYLSAYHMIYRANDPGRVGWATGSFPQGPFTKNSEPILGLNSSSSPVNGVSAAWQPSTYVEGSTLYLYWTDNAVGSINVCTGNPANPATLTNAGVALAASGTKKYYNTCVIKDTIASGYTMFTEVSDSASTHPFALVVAGASTPVGPFTPLATLPLFPTASAGASVASNAVSGGPNVTIENGRYVMVFHGGTNGSLPTRGYRATSSARASGWVLDPYPFIREATAFEADQVADLDALADGHGVHLYWEGVDNVNPSSVIYHALASPTTTYYDGTSWVKAPWDGTTTETRLLAQKVIGVTEPAFIDFENIEQEYDDLIIVIQGRGAAATTIVGCNLRFNAAAGTDYYGIATSASGSTLVAGESLGQTSARVGALPAATADANRAGFIRAEVPSYSRTAFHKNVTAKCTAGYSTGAGTQRLEENYYAWAQQAAITKLTILPSSGNVATDTVASVYGVR